MARIANAACTDPSRRYPDFVPALTDRNWFLLAVLTYGVSMIYSLFLWRKGFREDNRINYALLALAFVFHTTAMARRGIEFTRCPVNNLVIGLMPRFRYLGAFASPVLFAVGVFALMPALDVKTPTPEFTMKWASLHAALILLAYGAFGLSSVAGLMFLSQEHDLKFHKLRAMLALLPPIQRLEVVINQLLLGGFILLTAGLAISPLLMWQMHQVYFRADPKILWSVFVWLLYLGLLVSHWKSASSGRRFAWGAVGAFAFVLATFWGFNLLSGVHNP
jgi:HemX protein